MAKIITLPQNNLSKHQLPIQDYITAAWHLTCFSLWPFEKFGNKTLEECKANIRIHLSGSKSIQAAFITYCQRILLHHKLLQVSPLAHIDTPSLWLHPEFSEGYAFTQSLFNHVEMKRSISPGYQKGILLLTNGYWRYLHDPVPENLSRIYKGLLYLREYQLLQTLSHLIVQRTLK
jgi:hypothetical protein